jgi:hypothetical protein
LQSAITFDNSYCGRSPAMTTTVGGYRLIGIENGLEGRATTNVSVTATALNANTAYTGGAAMMDSPVAVRDASSGDQWLYYMGPNQQLYYWYWDSATSTWGNYELAGEAAAASNSSPTVVRDSSTDEQWVYYVGINDEVYYWQLSGSTWSNHSIRRRDSGTEREPNGCRGPIYGRSVGVLRCYQ